MKIMTKFKGTNMITTMITTLAIRWLTWRLRKDKDFWESYQSNITMVIFDRLYRYYPDLKNKEFAFNIEFCNLCANDFMELWTRK